jgi:LacI family transcriptional regulator
MESAVTFPTLSTMAQPIHEMGEIAAQTLVDHMQDPSRAPRQVMLENTLIERASTMMLAN